jgi:hypothetical protein
MGKKDQYEKPRRRFSMSEPGGIVPGIPPDYSLSISIEHFPEGMGRVFFFFPRIFIVK